MADWRTPDAAVALADFIQEDVALPRWAVKDIWPERGSGIIGGKPKAGKSTTAEELALSLSTGTPMFGLERFPVVVKPANVLLIDQENPRSRLLRDMQQLTGARRISKYVELEKHSAAELRAAGLDAAEDLVIGHYEMQGWYSQHPEAGKLDVLSHPGLDLANRECGAWLQRVAKEYDYLLLDPLYSLLPNTRITDGGDELRPVLAFLTALSTESDCAVILTHHMSGKSDEFGPGALLGSTFIWGWYSSALFLRSDGTDWDVKVDARRTHGTEETYRLRGEGTPGRWFFSEEAQGQRDSLDRRASTSARKATNIAKLRELLEGEGKDWDDARLARELVGAGGKKGVDERTVRRYRKDIANEDGKAILAGIHANQSEGDDE